MAVFAAALLAGRPAPAAEEVWVSPNGGLWSTATNWLDGTVPATGGDPTLTLRLLLPRPSFNTTSTNDLPGVFALHELIFDRAMLGNFTLAGNAGSSLRLSGMAPQIVSESTGQSAVSIAIGLGANDGVTTIGGSGAISLSGVLSEVSGPQRLIIASDNLVSLSGNNTFTGGVRLNSGVLGIGSNNALGTGVLEIHGGALQGNSSVTLPNAVQLHSDLELRSTNFSSGITFDGAVSSVVPGTGLRVRSSSSSGLQIRSASPYTGTTILDYPASPSLATGIAGGLSLSGAGALTGTSAIHVRAGAAFSFTSPDTLAPNRVGDTTPIFLRQGLLICSRLDVTLSGDEIIGPVEGAGYSTLGVLNTASNSGRIIAQSLARPERGTFLFRGLSLGASPNTGVSNILFTTAPLGLAGAGGSGPATSILPYAIGDLTVSGAGTSFVTYSAATGVRPLNTTTEYRSSFATTGPTENLRLTTAEVLSAPRTVNALLLDGGGVSGIGTLTLSSGALLYRSGAGVSTPVDFGTAEGQLFTLADTTLGGAIAGTNGWTKSGTGRLTLGVANSISGPLTINAGLLSFAALDRLGPDNSPIVVNGHGAGLNYTNVGNLTFARPIETRTGLARFDLTNAANVTVGTPITGEGGLWLSSSGGSFTLPAGSTYRGTTSLTSGTLVLPGDSALGDGGAVHLAGTVRLTGPWTTTREISSNNLTFDTNGFSSVWSGSLRGLGGTSLTKIGAGDWEIRSPLTFSGSTAINGGSLTLRQQAVTRSTTQQIGAGASLILDQSEGVLGNRLGDEADVTLNGGTFAVRGHATDSSAETIDTIVLGATRSDHTLALTATGSGQVQLTLLGGLTLGDSSLIVRAAQLGAQERLLVGPPGSLGTTIVSGVYADLGMIGAGEHFVVYDPTSDAGGVIGVRALRPAEYAIESQIENPITPINAHFLAIQPVLAAGAANTIESLTFAPGGGLTLGAGQSVGVTTGEVLVRASTNAVVNGGTLTFDTRRASFYTAGDLSVTSVITGSGGLRKSGPGNLTLSGPLGYTGGTMVVGGVLRAGTGDPFANETVTLQAAGTFDVAGSNISLGAVTGSGRMTFGGGTLLLGGLGTNITFGGVLAGSGQLTIVDGGNPSALRAFNSSSTLTGAVVLNSGRLQLGANGALGSASLVVNGGSLRASTAVTMSNLLDLHVDLPVMGSSPITLANGTSVEGSGGIFLRSATALNISGGLEIPGRLGTRFGPDDEFSLTPGTISVLGADGSVLALGGIHIEAGGRLSLNYATAYGGTADGRVPDTQTVTLRGSTLEVIGNSTTGVEEVLGSLNGAGFSTVSLGSSANTSTRLTAASANRMERGAFAVQATNGTLGGLLASNVAQLHFTSLPALTGGGGTGANTSIIPWAAATTPAFLTYDANGVRPLTAAEAVVSLGTAAATNNVALGVNATNSSAKTINSLALGAITLSGAGTLTITSGAVLATAGTGIGTISTPLEFGVAEAHFLFPRAVSQSLTVSGNLSGSDGLTRSGTGTLTLSGTNTFTGPITINGGALAFTAAANLGGGSDPITLHGSTASLTYNGASSLELTRPVVLGGGISRLTTGDAGALLRPGAGLSGPGGLRIVGAGMVELVGANTYAGPTFLEGTLRLAQDAALGSGGLFFATSGAQLALSAPWTASRRIEFQNASVIDTAGFPATLTGPLFRTGSGALTKSGAGALLLTAPSPFDGAISVTGGELQLGPASSLAATSYTLTGGTLVLNQTNSAVANNAAVALNGGELRLLGHATTAVAERVGAVSLGAATTNFMTVTAPGNGSTTLTLSSFNFGTGTLIFRGDQLGGPAGTAFTRIVFATPPTVLDGFILGAFADSSSSGTGTDLAFYDTTSDAAGVIGVRTLRPSDYATGSEIRNPGNGGTTPVNSHFLASGAATAGGVFNQVSTLRFSAGSSITLNPDQTLALGFGHIVVDAGATTSLSGGGLDLANTTPRWLVNGNLTFASRLDTTTVAKQGTGMLTLGPGAFFLGTLSLQTGTLQIEEANALRWGALNLSAGTSVAITPAQATIRTLTGPGTITLPPGTLTVRSISSPSLAGSGALRLTSSGSLSVPQSFSGTISVTGDDVDASVTPNLVISGDGTAPNVSVISLRRGSWLHLLNAARGLTRLGTTALDMDGGTLIFRGHADTPVAENLGTLTLQGYNTLTATLGGTGVAANLTFSGFTRNEHGTLHLQDSTNLGSGGAIVRLPASVAADLVGANTTALNRPILPYVSAFDSTLGTRPASFSAAGGLRPLSASELSGTLTAGNNVSITSVGDFTNDASVTVNSLSTVRSILGTGAVTITSGFFAANGAGLVENALHFGAAEAQFFISSAGLSLTGALTGSGGLTKSGTGVVILPASNAITGPLTVNAGALRFATPAHLGADTGEIVLNGGALEWSGAGSLTLPRSLRLAGGISRLGVVDAAATWRLTQPITGPGGLQLGNGFVFEVAQGYSGPTILAGTFTAAADSLFGPSERLEFSAGTLVLGASWNTSRALHIAAGRAGTIDSAGFDASFVGTLTGGGSFTKAGMGRLTLGNLDGWFGALRVTGGTLQIPDAVPGQFDQLRDTVDLTLSGGTIELPRFSRAGEQIDTISAGASTANKLRFAAPGSDGQILKVADLITGIDTVLLLQANNLGGAAGTAFTRLVETAPLSIGGFLGNWITADAMGAPIGFAFNDVTADAAGTIGVRAARPDEFVTGNLILNPSDGGTVPESAFFRATGPTAVAGSFPDIGALVLEDGAIVTVPRGRTLGIDADAVLVPVGEPVATLAGGILDFGTNANFFLGGDLVVDSLVSAIQLRKYGPGTLTLLERAPVNSVLLDDGTVVLAEKNPLAGAPVTLNSAARLDVASRSVSVAGLNGTGRVAFGTGGRLTLTRSGNFAGSTEGTGTLAVLRTDSSPVTLTPTGALTHAGAVVLDGGTLVLAGAGRLASVNTLLATNSGSVSVQQPSGLPATLPLTLERGTLELRPGSATLALGPLEVRSFGNLALQHDAAALQVNFASFNRGPHGSGILRLDPDNAAFGVVPGLGVANVRFGADFADHLVMAPGSTPIIPFLVGSLAPFTDLSYRLITYDSVLGARMLGDAEYSAIPTTGSHYRFSGSTFNSTVLSVATLGNTTDPATLNGSGTVEVSSGLVVLSGATIHNTIAFGARQGNIVANGSARFHGPITGTGGLTITGGEVDLYGANTFTGPFVVNQGHVNYASPASFGPDPGPMVLYGSSLEGVSGTFTRPVVLAGGSVRFSGSSGSIFTFDGSISGPGGLTLGFADEFRINGTNSYTGPTIIETDATIPGGAAFGQSELLALRFGTLRTNGPWTFSGAVLLENFPVTLDTTTADVTWTGPLSSASPNWVLTKQGTGLLRIFDGDEFDARIAVVAGILEVTGEYGGSITAQAGGTVRGNADVVGEALINGVLEPGASGGTFAAGNLRLQTGSTLRLELLSATDYDQVLSRIAPTLPQNVTLELQLAPGFDPIDGVDAFTILRNDSTQPIVKSVAAPFVLGGNALDENEEFFFAGQAWRLSYTGGTGNDAVLYAVPEPTITAVLLAAVPLLLRRRRPE